MFLNERQNVISHAVLLHQSIQAVNIPGQIAGIRTSFLSSPLSFPVNFSGLGAGERFRSGQIFQKLTKRAWEANFCRTFISSISLSLELAGSNLAQTLLNPSKFIWHRLFLLNVSVVFVKAEKRSAQNRAVFVKP